MYDCEMVTLPRARKEYVCTWCGEVIPKGGHAYYRTGKYQGEWMKERYHIDCFGAMRKMDLCDEFTPGENSRPAKESE